MSDDDSVPAAIAAGMAAGTVFILLIAAVGAGLWLAGQGLELISTRPALRGALIGSFGTLVLVTVLAVSLHESEGSEEVRR